MREQHRRGAALHEAPEQLVERRRLLFDVVDPVRIGLAQLGALRGVGDRILEPAERVDQAAFLALRAGPHPTAADRVDIGHGLVPRLRHASGEIAVALVDHALDHLPDRGIERAGDVERAGEPGGADAVGVHADLLQRARDGRDHAEDADGTGDRRRIGVDAVGVHADPVTAGRGQVAHRHHHRLAGVLQADDFAPDLLGGEHLAAGRIHAQHHRLHLVVVARGAQQFRGRFAADAAGRLLAAADLAFGHHHRDLRAFVHRRERFIDAPQVIVEADVAEPAVGIGVGDAAFGQQVLDLFLGLEPVDEVVRLRVCAEVALRGLDALRQVVDVGGELLRGDLARLADVGEVALPHVVHPEQVGFLRFGRGRVEDVGFGRGLVFADAEQVHVHAELVLQAFAVVLAVAAEPFEHDPAHRVEVDLAGLRRELVLALVEVLAERDHLLAGSAQPRDRRRHLARRGVAGEGHAVGAQQHALDALVVLRRVQRAQQVAQLHLAAGLVAHHARERAAGRVGAVLLDQLAFGRDHQRGAVGHRRHLVARAERDQHDQQQAEEQQVEHQPPGEVHRIPQADEEAGDGAAAARVVHVRKLRGFRGEG